MGDMLKLIWGAVVGLFRSRASLEAEILTLRHQLNVLRRKSPKRLAFSNFDRLIFASLYQIAPSIVNALAIMEPKTVIHWHRAGFRLFWRWKSTRRSGRPTTPLEIRQLIRTTISSRCHSSWGLGRALRRFLAMADPNFKTHRRIDSLLTSSPLSASKSSTSR